jgi:hypothetical protein
MIAMPILPAAELISVGDGSDPPKLDARASDVGWNPREKWEECGGGRKLGKRRLDICAAVLKKNGHHGAALERHFA